MIDPNTLGFAYTLAFSVGALFATAIAFIAAIIHLIETRKPPRRKPRRHTWSN